MSAFDRHPALRWSVPVAALGLVASGVLLADAADANSGLPEASPEQVLASLAQADAPALSGTVRITSDLGLPELPRDAAGPATPLSLLTGTHTAKVWYDGPTRSRVSLLADAAESAVVRNGDDVWLWSSADKTARHEILPTHVRARSARDRAATHTADLPATPQEAAQRALAAVDDTTQVSTSGSERVAGRDAYTLRLTPKTANTLVQRVDIAIDAERHVPLEVDVVSKTTGATAFSVGYTSVDFATPDPSVFAFTPPAGAKVTGMPVVGSRGTMSEAYSSELEVTHDGPRGSKPVTTGTGWDRVVVASLPKTSPNAASNAEGVDPGQWQQALESVPRSSGAWGAGRVFSGTLFSVVVTDDGRLAAGAVPADRLYAALARR